MLTPQVPGGAIHGSEKGKKGITHQITIQFASKWLKKYIHSISNVWCSCPNIFVTHGTLNDFNA